MEQPAAMVFHHGNAFERERQTDFRFAYSRRTVRFCRRLDSLANDKIPASTPNNLTRFTDRFGERKIGQPRTSSVQTTNFRVSIRGSTGKDARFLYTAGAESHGFLESSAIMRHDLQTGAAKTVAAGRNRIFRRAGFRAASRESFGRKRLDFGAGLRRADDTNRFWKSAMPRRWISPPASGRVITFRSVFMAISTQHKNQSIAPQPLAGFGRFVPKIFRAAESDVYC
ncbi:MAG: carotenoid oxygenase family protein [Pyrinomonadaceae bacterium]